MMALERSYLTENSSSENRILRPRRKKTPDRIPEKKNDHIEIYDEQKKEDRIKNRPAQRSTSKRVALRVFPEQELIYYLYIEREPHQRPHSYDVRRNPPQTRTVLLQSQEICLGQHLPDSTRNRCINVAQGRNTFCTSGGDDPLRDRPCYPPSRSYLHPDVCLGNGFCRRLLSATSWSRVSS